MKKIIYFLLCLLMVVGCSSKGVKLDDYKDFVNEGNRQNLVLYHNYKSSLGNKNYSELIEIPLKDVSSDDLHIDEEVAETVTEYYKNILDSLKFLTENKYEVLDNVTIDENSVRFILEDNNIQMNIYEDGYIKVINGDSKEYYHTDDKNFNDNLDKSQDIIDDMNTYLLEYFKTQISD